MKIYNKLLGWHQRYGLWALLSSASVTGNTVNIRGGTVAGGTYFETDEIIDAVGKVVEHNGTIDGKPAKIMWWLSGNREVTSYLKNTYGM